MSNIKRYFLTGLLITLPVFLTIYLLFIGFRFIDGIWGKLINIYLRKTFGFTVPGLGIILGLITVLVIGFVATNFFGRRFFHFIERWFAKFPIISQVYPAIKQIVDSLISQDKQAFKKVVLVEYPRKGLWSVGFITNGSFALAEKAAGEELIHILIPTTPSPFTGFLILVPKKDVKILDISIEAGVKLVVSGGIVNPVR